MNNKSKSREKLIQENEKLEFQYSRCIRLLENARDMIYRMSLPEGIYEYVSSASKEVFGYEPEVFYNNPVLIRDAIHPEFVQYFQKEWENLLNDKMPETYEYKIIHKSGEERWLNQRNVLIKNEFGKPIAIEGIVTDITARKKAEFERDKLTLDIGERVKELNCLYKISDYSFEGISIEEFIRKVIEIIPPSFQYPETTNAKITIGEKEYKNKNYKPSKWNLKHDIKIGEQKAGIIEINYEDEMPEHFQGPFLKEELNLINGIAEIVGRTIDFRRKEKELKEKNEEYLTINEELKEKNNEYQLLNEKYITQNEELLERNEEFKVINEELKKSNLQQLALFDGIDDVIYVADPDTYEILYFNKTARDIWGKDSLRKKCYEILQGRKEPCPFCTNDKIFGKDEGNSVVWEFQNEISKQWFRCSDKAIKWSNGKMVRFELASDITEQKNTQFKLQNTLKELERSNKELEQFAYVASHDLQEPLRKVKNFTELLERKYKGVIDSKADQYIRYITSGADRMQNLVLDLLTFSRVSTKGKDFVSADFNEIVQKVSDNLQLSIEEAKAHIVTNDLPVLKVDETQIMQVFQNLISNAIKFKSEVPPIININAVENENYWLFEIIDNGIGMDMQYKEKIFEIFQRLHTKEEYEGTGIGLAICKKIIERHNGKIWVESELGNLSALSSEQAGSRQSGTKFYFTIPKKIK